MCIILQAVFTIATYSKSFRDSVSLASSPFSSTRRKFLFNISLSLSSPASPSVEILFTISGVYLNNLREDTFTGSAKRFHEPGT